MSERAPAHEGQTLPRTAEDPASTAEAADTAATSAGSVPPGSGALDRDAALTLREPGVHGTELPEGWTILGGALHGGFLLSLLGRALGETLPHPHPFSITAHYLTASRPGPAVIRTQAVRAGRTLSTGTASLLQHDEDGNEVERVRVLASYGDLDALPDDVRTAAKPPAFPPVEQCFGAEDAPEDYDGPVVPFVEQLRMKFDPATLGWALGAPSGKGEIRAWFELADGREPDHLSLLVAVDALPSTAFELGLKGWVPTIELTAHVRARPAPGPLRVAVGTRNLAGGYLEEDAEIWDSADRLVAQSRQLARAGRN